MSEENIFKYVAITMIKTNTTINVYQTKFTSISLSIIHVREFYSILQYSMNVMLRLKAK